MTSQQPSLSDMFISKLRTYFADDVNVDVGDTSITFIDDKSIQFRSAPTEVAGQHAPDNGVDSAMRRLSLLKADTPVSDLQLKDPDTKKKVNSKAQS